MQEIIGNMTVEQFTQFLGSVVAYLLFVLGSGVIFLVLFGAIFDGWLFRKGALYYGSLRYLNKLFKNFKVVTSNRSFDIAYVELMSTIHLLRYQRIIPKIIYNRLLDRCREIYHQRY